MEYFVSSDCRHYFVGDSVPLTKNTETGIWISELKLKYSKNMQYEISATYQEVQRNNFEWNSVEITYGLDFEEWMNCLLLFLCCSDTFEDYFNIFYLIEVTCSFDYYCYYWLTRISTYIFPKHAISNRNVCDPLVYDNSFPICCCCCSAFSQPISLLSHPNIQHECNFCNRQLLFIVPAAIPEFHFISITQSNPI